MTTTPASGDRETETQFEIGDTINWCIVTHDRQSTFGPYVLIETHVHGFEIDDDSARDLDSLIDALIRARHECFGERGTGSVAAEGEQ